MQMVVGGCCSEIGQTLLSVMMSNDTGWDGGSDDGGQKMSPETEVAGATGDDCQRAQPMTVVRGRHWRQWSENATGTHS